MITATIKECPTKGGPWLNWNYVVDVYEENGVNKTLIARTYVNSIALAVAVVEAFDADAVKESV